MMDANETARADFRKLMSEYPISSRSDEVRLELCGLAETFYIAGIIGRDEFHSSLAYLR